MSKNQILSKMLDRLFAGLASGPNLNCRPHSSRQRFDWMQFAKLQDLSPGEALRQLLSDKQATQLQARVTAPKNAGKSNRKRSTAATNDRPEDGDNASKSEQIEELSAEERGQRDKWPSQQALLTKLRGLAEDARDYEQDTGVHVLHVGFPLLSLPPGVTGGTKRLLAPIAFIPVSLELRAGLTPVIAIEGMQDGADFLVPNEALFAWLERQTGQSVLPELIVSVEGLSTEPANGPDDLDASESRNAASSTPLLDPWEEVNDLTRRVAKALDLPRPTITQESSDGLVPAPRSDGDDAKPEIVMAAVLGLFPMNNQGLLRDMQAMSASPGTLIGPLQRFISSDSLLDETLETVGQSIAEEASPALPEQSSKVEAERFVTMTDPCQARAVRLARESSGLVIHGPPGTGKSQTITNIIGDHLARGERVLLVCDKRTALDVVARRLEHLGLGLFCALIHDPQHDQRNLYMQIREQLEQLTSTKTTGRAAGQLRSLDRQLQKSRETLAEAWSLVMSPDPQRGVSFHQRMGEWLQCALPTLLKNEIREDAVDVEKTVAARSSRRSKSKQKDEASVAELATVEMLERHLSEVRDFVRRAIAVELAGHPWRSAAGISLTAFLGQSAAMLREQMSEIVAIQEDLDRSADPGTPPFVVPDDVTVDGASLTGFAQQSAARKELAADLKRCIHEVDRTWRERWAKARAAVVGRARQQLQNIKEPRDAIAATMLDPKLRLVFLDRKLVAHEIATEVGTLEAYLKTCEVWYGWFAFGVRGRAQAILQAYGLPPGATSARQLIAFLSGVTNRRLLVDLLDELTAPSRQGGDSSLIPLDDDELLRRAEHLELLLRTLQQSEQAALATVKDAVRDTLTTGNFLLIDGLESSSSQAELLEDLRLQFVESGLFRADWMRAVIEQVCHGKSILVRLRQLEDRLESLGEVLRLEAILVALPDALRRIIECVITTTVDADAAMIEVRHQVLTAEIDQWLKSNPRLQGLDGTQLSNLYQEIFRLEQERQPVVRDLILDHWIGRQRERLLASTGTRLNGAGADLRRRLTTRGERAMRLRQVVSVGSKIEGGDPLFDLRPVWMASPETVAQIFPREAMFDVVIFDEASQCRLEEALPVLTRAKRVVIAGDPKQLPPTRFFESAVITSDNTDVETEQELFEAHQSEVEDLLTAALSLDIQESHLDVHYRSRNSDLVEFSNHQFYGSRLQAIPGHPRNRIRFAPISLYHVAGVYEERANAAEAAQVVKIVADLLRRSEPPSIGIACFNLTQRDQILEALAEMAAEDHDFAGRLAAARSRVGSGAFEGLFVKNLENVQGDERDHMIISTTYGPDKQGRFYRRFGPLGQVGGGRRLNVLVTRARDEVHLVTSIPPELYRNLPPVPEGQNPGGGWLLFAYLAYAERLSEVYRDWRSDDGEQDQLRPTEVIERPSKTPSPFANQLAKLMAGRHDIGSDTHWGNDGFCVDIAFHHPLYPEDRTLGLLCDGTRFRYADDPITWDVFRTAILEGQGWQLSRCWTPQFFRDPEGHLKQFAEEARRIADADPDPEAIPVEPV